jgi:hypothetical protein
VAPDHVAALPPGRKALLDAPGADPRKPRAGDVLIADPFDQHHEWHFGTWEELRKVQLERERRRRLKGEI